MFADFELEVTPRNCALLLAIPLTEDAFIAAYEDPTRDFCRQFDVGASGVAPRTVWSLFFERIAELVARLAASVERLGVTVVRGAGLCDWSEALGNHQVVTLVAHWRFVPITPDDITDPVALHRYGTTRATEIACILDDAIQTCQDNSVQIAHALEALCAPATRRYQAADRKGLGLERGINRVLLELHVPGLRAGAAIELGDGMHTAAAVIEATPTGYPGVIDLSVCNSILLAEALKYARRPALIVSGEFRASLAFRMIRYQVLIEHIHRRPARYTELLQQLGMNRRNRDG